MKDVRLIRHICRAFWFALLPCAYVMTLSGCESMQPIVDMGAAIGVATGTITEGQAQSIRRSGAAVAKTFQDITPEQEYYIGRAVAATILKRYPPYKDTEANYYLNLVGQTLAQASDKPETFGGYHFLILDSQEINAFAAPGGLILVTRGMLHCCTSEDALAAVLAHEIGHVQGQHGLRAIRAGRLTSALNILAVEGAKNFGGTELAELSQAFEGSIADITSTLMNNGYSRELEREADRSAVTILQRVGYDPRALISMLVQMKKQLRLGGAGFAKTHPDPEDRIRDIQSWMPNTVIAAAPPARQKRFEHMISGV